MSSSNYSVEIKFKDNADAVFYPGQTVKGQVVFIVTAPLKIRGLQLTIKGSAKCNYSKDLTAEQEFFAKEQNLVGVKGGLEIIELAPTTYLYEFEYRLPRNIPYTVEGVYGFVKYFVNACLDLPWDIYDKSFDKVFVVKRYEDLNYMGGMREPREVVTRKEIDSPGWIFWKGATGYVTLKGSIPHCGYAPGEKISVDVEINNQSTVEIESVIISLQNVASYVCQTPWARLEKSTQLKMSEVVAQGVKAGYTAKIKEKITVPEAAQITSVMYCNVYQISYNVQVSIKFRRWNNNVNLNIPVYIGSVGLKPVDEIKSMRIPPLWPPDFKVQEIDKRNFEKDNAQSPDLNDNSTEEATD